MATDLHLTTIGTECHDSQDQPAVPVNHHHPASQHFPERHQTRHVDFIATRRMKTNVDRVHIFIAELTHNAVCQTLMR